MRSLLQFLGFCFIVFFIIGEFQGWYVGMPPNTPMFLYKSDKTVTLARDVRFSDSLDLDLKGKVSRGDVKVEVFFEIPASFQAGTTGVPPKKVFSEEYFAGQSISLYDAIKRGKGRYTLVITYNDVSGRFDIKLPSNNAL